MKLTIEIESGESGLMYATSPDVPGLFLASTSLEELLSEVAKAIPILQEFNG